MDSNPERIFNTWPDRNCVIQIRDLVEFTKRITTALKLQNYNFLPLQIGPVVYTKTEGGHEQSEIADIHFQKNACHEHQREFRFVLIGMSADKQADHIKLNIGPCQDIVRIALQRNS